MKAQIKDQILDFMEATDTRAMSSNEFIWEFMEYYTIINDTVIAKDIFCFMPSVESFLRTRRKVIEQHPKHNRTQADSQEVYIEEFANLNP